MCPEVAVTARTRRVRFLSLAVFLVVAGLAVGGSLGTRQVVSDQERKLLHQRTDEAALYLSSVFGSVQGEMSSIAATAALSKADPKAFAADNLLLTKVPQGFTSIALVRLGPPTELVATAGTPITDLGSVRATAVNQAYAARAKALTGALVATPLFDGTGGKDRRLGFAYYAPQLPGYAVYAEARVQPSVQSPATAGQPFSELIAAVYAVPRVQADQLIAATGSSGHLPLRGHIASAKSQVGQGPSWLLVAKARRPLVGSVASFTPWAILMAGLLAAALATAVVEVLSRRREYATQVADDRTRELQQSLEDLAAAHEQLVRQERLAAIGELASSIGHELRNPLGVISNALYLLRGDIAKRPDAAADRHLATAEREVSAATVIVADLLEFARQRDPVITDVDITGLVDEVLTVLPPPAGIEVDRQLPSGPLSALADRDMLRQVLLNLLGNAYQAMPEGGRVSVEVSDERNVVRISVADTGAGMTQDVKDSLFQPFFTTKARGIGLGLAVCKRIIDAHSGRIEVDSTPGQGAEFIVTLPALRLPQQQATDEESAAEVQA